VVRRLVQWLGWSAYVTILALPTAKALDLIAPTFLDNPLSQDESDDLPKMVWRSRFLEGLFFWVDYGVWVVGWG